MGFLGFDKTSVLPTTDSKDTVSKDVVPRYKRYRQTLRQLNDELVQRLSTDVLKQGAKSLGMLQDDVFVFNCEDESSVLMDYCIHEVYRSGRNAIEQYLSECPPEVGSVEMECLRAMQRATYAIIAVLDVQRGVGCTVRNLYTGETRLLANIGFSKTGEPGAVIATHLLDYGDFITTSGAALPLGLLEAEQLDEWERDLRTDSDNYQSDPAPLIRECLARGALSYIRYESFEPRRQPERWRVAPPVEIPEEQQREIAKRRINPNRRCRCKSGKMFKNCCGKRKAEKQSALQRNR